MFSTPLRHRVVDVEQLHVEEDLDAVRGELAGEVEAAGEGQLVADLVEGDDAVEFAHHLLGLGARRHVEPDDQPLADIGRAHGAEPRRQQAGVLDQRLADPRHPLAQPLLLEVAVLVERLGAVRHRDLRRDHLHADMRQHGAQMVGAADAGEVPVGRRADADHLAGVGAERLAAVLVDAAHPVDRVLHQRRHRAVILRRADQHGVMGGDQPRQLHGVFGNAFFALEILVHERQRIVGERDAGHLGALQGKLLLRRIGGAAAIGAGADRPREHQYSGNDRQLRLLTFRPTAIGQAGGYRSSLAKSNRQAAGRR